MSACHREAVVLLPAPPLAEREPKDCNLEIVLNVHIMAHIYVYNFDKFSLIIYPTFL